jgi:cytochrome c-type biogenesis protein CcmH/NrfG
LQDLVQRNPSSFDGHYRLGVLYLQEKNFPRAVLTLQKAVRRQPNSADAFFMLGQAEEAQSHYRDAQKAYARALQFAADNRGFRQRYEALLKKLQTDEGIPRKSEITDSGAVKYPSYSPPKS